MDDVDKGGEPTTQSEAEDLPPRLNGDEFYRALASFQRRRLLYYLLETPKSTVDELATVLSGWEATSSGTIHTQADRSKYRAELVHSHLPLLADAGLIESVPDTGSVRIEPLHHRVKEIIRQSIAAEDGLMSPTDA